MTFGDETLVLDPAMTADDVAGLGFGLAHHAHLRHRGRVRHQVQHPRPRGADLRRGSHRDRAAPDVSRATPGRGADSPRCAPCSMPAPISPTTRSSRRWRRRPGSSFVLFADRRPRFVRGWQWRPLPRGDRGAFADPRQPLRQVLPARIFPEAEILDLRRRQHADPRRPRRRSSPSSSPRAPTSGCSRTSSASTSSRSSSSAGRWARSRRRTPARARRRCAHYRAEGLPRRPSLHRERHHLPPARQRRRSPRRWSSGGSSSATYTKRDQLSLPYVLHKSELKVKLWDWNYKFENPYFKRYLHRRGRSPT